MVSVTRKTVEEVYVFCDCSNAIDCVNTMQFKSRHDIFVRLHDSRYHLHELLIQIKLVNIIGHSGIQGNEIADEYAKHMAHKLLKGVISVPATVFVNDAFRIFAEVVTKSREHHWDNYHIGRYTHN